MEYIGVSAALRLCRGQKLHAKISSVWRLIGILIGPGLPLDTAGKTMNKQFSTACERNQEPIFGLLGTILAEHRRVLEIGSGTGQHAMYFAARLPQLTWQTSDLPQNHASILSWQQEAQLPNVLPPLTLDMRAPQWPEAGFDAVFTANTCHIMAWPEVERMFAGIGRLLPAGGVCCVYGPFNYDGAFTSASNARFDAMLRQQAPQMGLRDFEAVNQLALGAGLELEADHAMPANNRLLVWRRPLR
jgi:cyclopropane fatty-acyl-phospholipid synthase-like methyltransferase